VTASGLPGYESETFVGSFVPVKTPPAIIRRLSEEAARVVNEPEAREKFVNLGLQVVGSSAQEFEAALKTDIATLGKLIKDLGIKPD
jgi:tripartite-type tricarboxylate transporter receptor subunit TctC